MPSPVLARFETQVLRNSDSGDGTQVPYTDAQVSFFFQGATASESTGAINPGQLAQAKVDNPGSLRNGDIVAIGFDGPRITVEDALLGTDPTLYPGPVTVQLRNTAGQQVSVAAGTRLVIAGRRPDVYADPIGSIPLAGAVFADSDGRVAVYLAEPRFDYLVTKRVTVLASSTGTSSDSLITWDHPGSNSQDCVLITVSAIPAYENGPPAINSVLYGGKPAALVGNSGYGAVYRLDNPLPGTQQVRVQFTTSPVNAVASAHSLVNVAVGGGVQVGIGAGRVEPPNPGPVPAHAAFLHVTVNTGSPGQVAIPAVPAYQLANLSNGSGIYYTLGAASLNTSWATSPAATWELVALELIPLFSAPAYFVPDAEGGVAPSPSWLNLRDFANLRDAIDALPTFGGEIFIPTGIYEIGSPIEINKQNVTLRGEGFGSILRAKASVGEILYLKNLPGVGFDPLRLYNLEIDGNGLATNCVKIQGVDQFPLTNHAQGCYFENVLIRGAKSGGAGLAIVNTILFNAMHCQFSENAGYAVTMERTGTGTTNTLRFIGCTFSSNARAAVAVTGQVNSLTFLGCGFQSNLLAPQTGDTVVGIVVDLLGYSAPRLEIVACYFEHTGVAGTNPDAFISLKDARGSLIEGSFFQGRASGSGPLVAYAVNVLSGSHATRIANCYGVNLAGGLISAVVADGSEMANVEYGHSGQPSPRAVGDLFAVRALPGRAVVALRRYSSQPPIANVPDSALIWYQTAMPIPSGEGLEYWGGGIFHPVGT